MSLPPPFDVHGSAELQSVDQAPVAARVSSSGVRSAVRVGCNTKQFRDGEPSESAPANDTAAEVGAKRTIESRRAEDALARWRASKPKLAKARDELTTRLIALWDRLQAEHGNAYSNGAVARACGVDRKIVCEWRNGERQIPLAAIALLPGRFRAEALDVIDGLKSEMQWKAAGQ